MYILHYLYLYCIKQITVFQWVGCNQSSLEYMYGEYYIHVQCNSVVLVCLFTMKWWWGKLKNNFTHILCPNANNFPNFKAKEIAMIWTKHKWNYSLFSWAYHLIMITWLLISWVTNTLTIIDFDIVHRIDYQSRTLCNEHFRAWILAEVDIVDVLFCVFRFSTV